MIKLIVGLANPGVDYVATRHNAGAWYINRLARRLCITLRKESKFFGYTSCISLFNTKIHLLIPNTFMNLSGKAVVAMSSFYCIDPNEILIAHDELDLLPGIAKFKFNGSCGGHNGLRDIINKFSNNSNFYRLRLGIGHPGDKNKIVNFVLSEPLISEKKLIYEAIDKAAYCTEVWLQEKNFIKAVNKCMLSSKIDSSYNFTN